MKSFKVKYNPSKAAKNFKGRFEKFKKEKAWKEEAAKTAIKNIQGQTRLGKNISTGEGLKKIKKSTIEDKKKFAKNNTPGTSFSPRKSNLTRSGQLIESLKRKKDRKSVIISPDGKRKPYKGNTKIITNNQLAQYLKEKGYSFVGFNDKLKKQIKTKLLRHLRRSVLRK